MVDEEVDVGNTISGTITDFKDGGTDLGFKVELNSRAIIGTDGGIGVEWIQMEVRWAPRQSLVKLRLIVQVRRQQVIGAVHFSVLMPLQATATTEAEDPDTKLPSGVAGEFNVSSTYTKVVGAFAAELQQ